MATQTSAAIIIIITLLLIMCVYVCQCVSICITVQVPSKARSIVFPWNWSYRQSWATSYGYSVGAVCALFWCVCMFETKSSYYVALAILEFAMQISLASNSQSSTCLGLLSAGIKDMWHLWASIISLAPVALCLIIFLVPWKCVYGL